MALLGPSTKVTDIYLEYQSLLFICECSQSIFYLEFRSLMNIPPRQLPCILVFCTKLFRACPWLHITFLPAVTIHPWALGITTTPPLFSPDKCTEYLGTDPGSQSPIPCLWEMRGEEKGHQRWKKLEVAYHLHFLTPLFFIMKDFGKPGHRELVICGNMTPLNLVNR